MRSGRTFSSKVSSEGSYLNRIAKSTPAFWAFGRRSGSKIDGSYGNLKIWPIFWPGDLDPWPTSSSMLLTRTADPFHMWTNFGDHMSKRSRVMLDKTDRPTDRQTNRQTNILTKKFWQVIISCISTIMSAMTHIRGMFLFLGLPWACWIKLAAQLAALPFQVEIFPTKIICRVLVFVICCTRGFKCRRFTACPLFVGPFFYKYILNDVWKSRRVKNVFLIMYVYTLIAHTSLLYNLSILICWIICLPLDWR